MKIKKKYSIILSILGILQIIAMLMIPLFSKYLVDEAEKIARSEIKDYKNLIIFIISIFSCVILAIIFKITYNILYSSFYLKRDKYLKNILFNNIINTDFKALDNKSGQLEQLFHEDIRNVIKYELDTIPNIVRQISRLFLASLMLIYIDWKFLIFILICGILGFGFAKIYSIIIRPYHKSVLEADGNANSFLIESFNQIKLIQSYDAYDRVLDYYDELNKNSINKKRKRNNIIYGANSGIFAFTNIIYVLALCYGAFFIAKGDITYGSLFALIQLLSNIQNPLLTMSPLFNHISLGDISLKRLNKMINNKKIDKDYIDDFDEIIFENVSFSYDNEKYVIKDFNLSIKKNDVILFSGESGIGKTTLFMLLLGYYSPNSGRIYVKYNNEEIDISSKTRGLFSYVPQENIIFSGSIEHNLYLLTGKNNDEIKEVLEKVNLLEYIDDQNINKELKEKGAGLSIGQIQRILISAAILRNSKIFLLDEFSSALDETNEDIIINNIMKLNKTIIYITHRKKQIDGQKIINLKENA